MLFGTKYSMDFFRSKTVLACQALKFGGELGCSRRRMILGSWLGATTASLPAPTSSTSSTLSICILPRPMKALRGFVGSRSSTTPETQPSAPAIFSRLCKLDLPADQSHESPLLTLTLSAPSFLDAVVKDEFSDSPLYIIETHRDRTGIHRCETENITSVAKVQWPSRSKMISANAVALSGISIQMHGGRWRPGEEFLKFGSLFTYASPHSLGLPLFPSHMLQSITNNRLSVCSQFSQVSHPAPPP